MRALAVMLVDAEDDDLLHVEANFRCSRGRRVLALDSSCRCLLLGLVLEVLLLLPCSFPRDRIASEDYSLAEEEGREGRRKMRRHPDPDLR